MVDGHKVDLATTPNQPSQGKSNFGDSSGPLFSIYSDAAKEEDKDMVEGWQKDAEGIIIFVRPCAGTHIFMRLSL
jgi:hypothetical protein